MSMQEISYRENIAVSRECKEAYIRGIKNLIENREQAAEALRDNYCKDIFFHQEKYREKLKAMLGWPLTEKQNSSVPKVTIEMLSKDKPCTIYRITLEVLEYFSVTGLLFQKDDRKRPLVIAQHGGEGTPEMVGNLYGATYNYNHMIERMLQYDVNVFAPQLLLWGQTHDVVYDRKIIDAQLKRVGSSITALEVYGLTRVLDYFETQDYVSSFGMIGLSYGGFYTLFTAAVDTRIKAAISCSFFNVRNEYAWSDWTWFRSAEMFSDAEVACLVYPRRLCIEVGTRDEIFDIESARKELGRLEKVCNAVDKEWLEIIEFDGTHEFCLEDAPLEKLSLRLREATNDRGQHIDMRLISERAAYFGLSDEPALFLGSPWN